MQPTPSRSAAEDGRRAAARLGTRCAPVLGRTSRCGLLGIGILLAAAVGCQGSGGAALKPASAARQTEDFRGVSFSVIEETDGGVLEIPPVGRKDVDLNSTLIVDFDSPSEGDADPATSEWQLLQTFLDEIKDLSNEMVALDNVTVDLSSPQARAALRKSANEFNQRSIDAQNKLKQALMSVRNMKSSEVDDLYDRVVGKPWVSISTWLRDEVEDTQRRAQARVDALANAKKMAVTVEAFHQPVGGELKQLHVENYDTIPAGKYEPTDGLGLSMTTAEQKRLNMELEQSQKAANAIREIRDNKEKIGTFVAKLVRDLEDRVEAVSSTVKKDPKTALSEIVTFLGSADRADKQAAKDLALKLVALERDADRVAKMLEAIASFVKAVKDVDAQTILGLVTSGELTSSLSTISTGLKAAVKLGDSIPKAIADALPLLKKELPALESTVLDSGKDYFNRFAGEFPNTTEAIKDVIGLLTNRAQMTGQALEQLAGTDDRVIHRPAVNLPSAQVVIPSAGATTGDRITLKVRFYQLLPDGSRGEVLFQREYRTRTVLVGLHRRFSGQLIFTRGLSGTAEAKSWQPNVATEVNWHYFFREPECFGSEFWNWLDPGAGIHVASLDQGDENVEVGIGANLTFWGGLITVGGGYNFSIDNDNEYVYVGIDLLHALEGVGRGFSNLGEN